MAGTEKSAANNGRETDHEADGKDDKSGSSSFIDPGINHFANDMIPVLYDWQIEKAVTRARAEQIIGLRRCVCHRADLAAG
jgi:hypothetical protein